MSWVGEQPRLVSNHPDPSKPCVGTCIARGVERVGTNPTSPIGFLHDRGEHHDVRRARPALPA